MPPARLHPAAGRRPGHAGLDPAGQRRSGRGRGGDRRGRAGPRRVPPGLLNPVPAQRARLLLAQGDLAAAARWAQQSGLGADDEPDYPREPGQLVLARVLLAQDRPGPALALLDRLHAAAVAQDRIGSVIEIGALRALALAASGDEADAVTAPGRGAHRWPARRATSGSSPTRARRWPRCSAGWSRPSAAGQAAAGVPLGYLARLQRAFGAGPAAPGQAGHRRGARPHRSADQPRAGGAEDAGGGAVEPGHRRPSWWSPWTRSRSTWAIVLGKLGAANRTEAVARARELSLIP